MEGGWVGVGGGGGVMHHLSIIAKNVYNAVAHDI